jgi:hypothetical protein
MVTKITWMSLSAGLILDEFYTPHDGLRGRQAVKSSCGPDGQGLRRPALARNQHKLDDFGVGSGAWPGLHRRKGRCPKVLNFFLFLKSVLKSSALGGLNGPLLPGNLSKKVGASPPTFFDTLLGRRGPLRPPKTDDFRNDFLKVRSQGPLGRAPHRQLESSRRRRGGMCIVSEFCRGRDLFQRVAEISEEGALARRPG